jgi:hypothetical protein
VTPRERRIRQKLLGLTVPMAPVLLTAPALEGAGASAQSDGRTIFFDGKVDNRTFAHEAAHNLDAQVMTDADRRRFAQIMGRGNKPWDVHVSNGGQATVGHSSVSERFADMTAMLATRKFPEPGRGGGFGYMDDDPPNLRELLRFGRSLERLAARNNLQAYRRPQ